MHIVQIFILITVEFRLTGISLLTSSLKYEHKSNTLPSPILKAKH